MTRRYKVVLQFCSKVVRLQILFHTAMFFDLHLVHCTTLPSPILSCDCSRAVHVICASSSTTEVDRCTLTTMFAGTCRARPEDCTTHCRHSHRTSPCRRDREFFLNCSKTDTCCDGWGWTPESSCCCSSSRHPTSDDRRTILRDFPWSSHSRNPRSARSWNRTASGSWM